MEKLLESIRKVNLKGEYLAQEKLSGGKRHNQRRGTSAAREDLEEGSS